MGALRRVRSGRVQLDPGIPTRGAVRADFPVASAALSAPTNIVEGASRRTQRDYAHFLNLAKASLEEAGYLIGFARRVEYLDEIDAKALLLRHDEAARVLHGLIARIRKDLPNG